MTGTGKMKTIVQRNHCIVIIIFNLRNNYFYSSTYSLDDIGVGYVNTYII